MKLKLAVYCVIVMMGLSTALYAIPDYTKLSQLPVTPKEKQVTEKAVTKITHKNNTHHFKSRVHNSTRPMQRCLKALKI